MFAPPGCTVFTRAEALADAALQPKRTLLHTHHLWHNVKWKAPRLSESQRRPRDMADKIEITFHPLHRCRGRDKSAIFEERRDSQDRQRDCRDNQDQREARVSRESISESCNLRGEGDVIGPRRGRQAAKGDDACEE
jgi:hypothetical protein